MKKLISSLLALMLILGLSGCGDDKPKTSPIKISVEQAYNEAWNYYYPKVIITSIDDNVNIKNVLVNKGNCKYSNQDLAYVNGRMQTIKLLPRKLTYGKQLEIRLKKCEVLRIDVQTDKGSWTVEY